MNRWCAATCSRIGIRWGNSCAPAMRLFTIVGVVGGVKHSGLNLEPKPTMYWHYLQSPNPHSDLAVRTAGDPAAMIRNVKRALYAIDRDQPVFNVRTMDQVIDDSTAPRRMTLALLGIFALVALTLASIGIYGVMSYTVGQRTHEIGIRMAMGAETGGVLRLVVGTACAWRWRVSRPAWCWRWPRRAWSLRCSTASAAPIPPSSPALRRRCCWWRWPPATCPRAAPREWTPWCRCATNSIEHAQPTSPAS